MKIDSFFVLFALIAVNEQSMVAAPSMKLRPSPMPQSGKPGAIQCAVPVNMPGKLLVYDKSPEINALAQKYQIQLFDSNEGRKLLLRFKNLKQSCAIRIHVRKNGNVNAPIENEIFPIVNEKMHPGSDPKYVLQNDLDRLVGKRWNKPSLLKQPLTSPWVFEIKITATGDAHVLPLSLR